MSEPGCTCHERSNNDLHPQVGIGVHLMHARYAILNPGYVNLVTSCIYRCLFSHTEPSSITDERDTGTVILQH